MAGTTVNGSGNGARSGAQTLTLLATPLNVRILQALAAGGRRQASLRNEVGSPAQSTLRTQLKRLGGVGAIARRRHDGFPGVVECELTTAGRELLTVAALLEQWLARAPQGQLAIDGDESRNAAVAMVEGWSTTMLRALAACPLCLTELDNVIGSLSYPALERRLAAMRLAGQVKAVPGSGRGTPYAVTEWLRQGIGTLMAACRWELRHQPPGTVPMSRLDVETALLLTVPRLILPVGLGGTCRLAVSVPNGERRLAGVTLVVEHGVIVACSTRLDGDTDACALGSIGAWLDAMAEDDLDRLELGGDRRLAQSLADALHRSLSGVDAARRLPIPP